MTFWYAGLEGKTKEDLLSPTPIKEDEETLQRVIDILWKKQLTKHNLNDRPALNNQQTMKKNLLIFLI